MKSIVSVTTVVLTAFFLLASASRTWDTIVIDDFVESVRKCRDRPAVTIAIIKLNENDEIEQAYANAYGRTDPACTTNCDRPTNRTKFCIGSITKQFTAGVVGMALKESPNFSKSSWDSKLVSILGDRGKFFGGDSPAELVTVRDLLAHRMGIPAHDGGWLFGLQKSHDELVSNIHTLNGYDPSTHFRSSFQYNNWMYRLAGYVAEYITGSSWENLIQKHYFTPLQMKQADFIHTTNPSFDGFAKVGVKLENGTWSTPPFGQLVNTSFPDAPAGAICGSSSDFINYIKFLLTQNASGSLTANLQELLKVIHETWLPSNSVPYQPQGQSNNMFQPRYPFDSIASTYGLGWYQGIWRSHRCVMHEGSTGGWLSSIKIFPDARAGVLVSTTNSINDIALESNYFEVFVDWLSDYILGYEPWLTKQSACTEYPKKWYSDLPSDEKLNFTFTCEIKETDAQVYVGEYEHPMFGIMAVTYSYGRSFTEGTLRWSLGHFGRGKLCKTTPNTGILHGKKFCAMEQLLDLKTDDFRMTFDNETMWHSLLNDPTTNIQFEAVLTLIREGAKRANAVNVGIIEAALPPKFVRIK